MVNVPKANGITHYHHNNTASPSARRGEPSDDSDGGVSESGTFVKKTKIWVGDIRNVALGRKTTRSTRMRLIETGGFLVFEGTMGHSERSSSPTLVALQNV
ncbi:hypothetical protein GEV33_011804 [Tenebrio molitor]|uniref:Uncharacterized protein n=1 Tax=Tenebrio molitor TaxID=7067 RepID=A0A8J6L480_TENMO|nr:hypothetical protein GEV33_011804 [Tenebrio molitor]